jgi:hypothetical protein
VWGPKGVTLAMKISIDGTEAVNCDDAIRVTLPDVDIDYRSTRLR